MLQSIAQRLFGSANDREVKRLQGIVNEINSMEADIEKLTDEQLINAMVENPILIERPIVVRGNKARMGRPPEQVLEIL